MAGSWGASWELKLRSFMRRAEGGEQREESRYVPSGMKRFAVGGQSGDVSSAILKVL
jgi:hypothetical protein